MKKIVLVCMLFLGMAVAFADATALTQFRQYVELTRKSPSNPEGMTVVADETYRILYVSMPIAVSSKDLNAKIIEDMKKNMLAAMRNSKADISIIKDIKINIVYTFITSDKQLFSIPISYKDF